MWVTTTLYMYTSTVKCLYTYCNVLYRIYLCLSLSSPAVKHPSSHPNSPIQASWLAIITREQNIFRLVVSTGHLNDKITYILYTLKDLNHKLHMKTEINFYVVDANPLATGLNFVFD